MLLVDRHDVGVGALARMRRDGVLTELTDDAGLATDALPLHIARAIALRPWVPRRAAATGLAALWIYGVTGDALLPTHVAVVVPRGAHPDRPTGVPRSRWTFTTHQAAYARARVVAGVRVVAPADAAASALRTADLGAAMAAAFRVAVSGIATRAELCEAVSQHNSARQCTRGLSAWRAVQDALEGR
ncbi:MAG: hypothetical protein CVT68_12965 [Actinobacteria bacterium HGW-Actinobacteria-8]|nr:MAG: hypothetical protein CVT68_12965 [Actinobacteria bacterium HGW-Actinobacteria-8]